MQLILAKYFLPWFGGTPALWTTCMFFFQVLLVVGYLYSHVVSRRASLSLQGRLHSVVLAGALSSLLFLAMRWHSPLLPDSGWKPTGPDHPIARLVLLLSLSAGVPYFLLSTTGPLLQSWFVRAYPGVSPYRLYSLSNLGSFLALLSYPFAVEPWLTLTMQARIWCGLFFVFVLLCGFCAQQIRKTPTPETSKRDLPVPPRGRSDSAPGFRICALWFALAACGSLLFLATTNQICQNIAVVPLLWVLPLSIYLLTLVISFDKSKYYSRALFHPALVFGLVLAIFLLNQGVFHKLAFQIAGYAFVLFIGCMVCHGELVLLKPSPRYLTLFYLMVAVGGAAAGVLVVLVAPRVFNSFWEYQLGLWLTALLLLIAVIRERGSWVYANRFGVLLIPFCAAVLPGAVTLSMKGRIGAQYVGLVVLLLLGISVVALKGDPGYSKAKAQAAVLFTGFTMLLLGAIFVVSAKVQAQGAVLSVRNFYGVLVVKQINRDQPEWQGYGLSHGLISHGFQFRTSPKNQLATSYFGSESGVGRAVAALRQAGSNQLVSGKIRFGVLGLGVGTLAAYAKPGDSIRFYEINPGVIRIAENQNYFTYLSNCPVRAEIVPGDARLSMERELLQGHPQKFDLLVVDAFSGDAPPVHLLTRQAFRIYLGEIATGGIIAVNVTNTYVDLRPVVAGIAQEFGLSAGLVHSDGDGQVSLYSDWILLSKGSLRLSGSVALVDATRGRRAMLWTDDYSNLIQVLR
jgi:hypothetical protein